MKVKIKKLHPDAKIPQYAKPGDAAVDLIATTFLIKTQPDQYIYGTGIAVEIPSGYVGLIFPRSSICKTRLSLSNAVGVIDSGYRGEIKFVFNVDAKNPNNCYHVGDRLGQLLILPYPTIEFEEVDELSETERGQGGFGHTGQ